MSVQTEEPSLSHEDRLKAIAYQFIKLYERWSEDRQAAIKQQSDLAELTQELAAQVKSLKKLEPTVREQIINSIQQAAAGVAKVIGEETSRAANRELEQTARQLASAVQQAQQALNAYERNLTSSQFKFFTVSLFASVLIGLFAVWLFVPKPQLALTDEQMLIYQEGQIMHGFWDKLTKKEQERLIKLANGQTVATINHPVDDKNSDNAQ